MRGKLISFCILFSVTLTLFNCQPENPNSDAVNRLEQFYEETLKNINYPYHNSLKADFLLKQLAGIPSDMPIEKRYDAAYELLKAGRNQDCIDLVTPITDSKKLGPSTYKYYRILALAFLRLGEQQNCFHKSGVNACTLPFSDETTHSKKIGSTSAIEIYKLLTQSNPNDLESRWLLNIAARTIEQYDVLPESSKVPLPETVNDEISFRNVFSHSTMGHAGGSAFEDYDNDGDLDLFTTSYHLNENVTYYRNDNGKYKNRTEAMFLKGISGGLNFVNADVNNDGFVDILILRGGWLSTYGQYPPSLLINQAGKGFIDETINWGLNLRQPTQTASFVDLNLDGKLDLIMGAEATRGMNIPVRVFKNSGSSFVDITEESGLKHTAYVKAIVSSDVNNDNYPDVFISVLGGDNKLFINKGSSEILFEEKSEEYKIELPWASFSSWFFDYNNDGYEDLFVSGYNIDDKQKMIAETVKDFYGDTINYSHPKLYKNIRGERFDDVTNKVGLNHEIYAMGANFGDVNNDGFLDMYIGTGEFNMWTVMTNKLFVNRQGERFEDESFSSGLAMIQKGHGVSFGDYDEDGDQDIFHTIGGAVEGDIFQNYLYQNNSKNGNWIQLNFTGETCNTLAIGAKVELTINSDKRSIFRTVSSGGSFGNNSLRLEIGVSQAEMIDSIKVKWPNLQGKICIFENITVNKRYHIKEENCEINQMLL